MLRLGRLRLQLVLRGFLRRLSAGRLLVVLRWRLVPWLLPQSCQRAVVGFAQHIRRSIPRDVYRFLRTVIHGWISGLFGRLRHELRRTGLLELFVVFNVCEPELLGWLFRLQLM